MKRQLGAFIFAALLARGDSPEAERWWSHVKYLADDKLEGRDTGSEGHRTAARYIAAEFERAGLKAAGTDGYMQPVGFKSYTIDEAASSVELIVDGETIPLRLGEDIYFNLRGETAELIEAPLVFAGHGFAIAGHKYDEFEGLDLKGKVVVYLGGGPRNFPAPLLAHNQSAGERWRRVRQKGGIGMIAITNPSASDIPWSRASRARLSPSMNLMQPMPSRAGLKLNLIANAEHADKLFTGTSLRIKPLLDMASSGKRLPKMNLKARVRARATLRTRDLNSENVIGLLPGTDASRKSQYLVITAHLDHVGTGTAVNGDRIFNGAMDNASGIAALIEIAKQLRDHKLSRTVVFAAVTGEEKGLLGSTHFALSPTVPKEGIVANLNFDMFLPLFPLKSIIVYGADESTLGNTVRRVAADASVAVMADPEPQRNSFIRSDQYSFVQRGIPALAFKFGYERGSPEETKFKAWLKERYHAVSDDLDQPVDREAAAQFTALMARVVEAAANEDKTPSWVRGSVFSKRR